MNTITLLLLACSASTGAIDSNPDTDTGAVYERVSPDPTPFECDSLGRGLADIPPGAYAVAYVEVGCDGDNAPTNAWSLSASRVIVDCEAGGVLACGGFVAWR